MNMKKIVAFLVVCLYIAGTATVWGKEDKTLLITNPKFDDATGWKFTEKEGLSTNFTAINNCAEQWQRKFDFYQELSGLDNGYYKVSVQGFYRAGGGGSTGTERHAVLYANDATTQLASILSEAGNPAITGSTSTPSGYGAVPNDIASANGAFAENLYSNFLFVQVTDGKLKFGIKKETTIDADWTCFDNFTLTYYGTGEVSDQGARYLRNRQTGKFLTGGNRWGTQATLHETGIEFQHYLLDGKYSFKSSVYNNNSAKQYLNQETDRTGYIDYLQKFYTLEQVGEYYTISEYGKFDFFTSSDNSTVVKFEGKDPNSPYAQWELLTKQDLIDELANASSVNPMNATFFIPGFDFNRNDKSRNGKWQGNPTPTISGYNNADNGAKWCASATGASFDVSQVLEGLPKGIYVLTAQACFQNGADANSTAVTAQLYATTTNSGTQQVALPTINDGGTRPTSHETAVDAFLSGRYQTVQVTVQVGDDGKLTIGVKNNGGNAADVAYFDNFHLTYYGEDQPVANPYTDSGIFYLKNEGTGEYLQGGGIDGLQAMLGNGIEFELVKNFDGIYHIRNVGLNPDGHDYLSDERRLDHQPVKLVITETNTSTNVYNIATQSGFLLTAVAGNSNNGERYKDLNDFTLDEWNGVTPGSTFKQSWTDRYEGNLHPMYQTNEYSKGALVYGTGDVNGNVHPNLTGYTTMTIKGTSGSRLRVLFNCEGGANSGAPRKEEVITIGESGYYTIDLTPYGYFHLNAIKVPDVEGATATIESITLDKFDVVDANLGTVQFALWSQAAPGGTRTQLNPQNFYNNVGKTITASNLVYGDAGVWPLNYADLTGYKSIRIKATPEAKLRFLFNREGTNDGESSKGSFVEKIVTIESDGYGFLDLSEYSYVHLNSIKTANDSKEAYIEEIMLSRKNNSVMFLAGADKWNNRSQWRFVTEDQRIQELAGATRANPKNATFLIKNASLTEIDNEPNNVEASPFWKLAEHWYFIQRDGTVHTDGAGGIVNSKTSANDVYQELANLPNGLYEVSMQGCYRNFDNAVFYANGTSVSLDLAGSEFDNCNHSSCNCRMVASVQTYGTNNYKKTLRVVVTDGKLRIGVKGNKNADNNLLIYDNFTLSYLGEVEIKTYYMRNVATGDFIRAGGHYEAQAIRDEWGMPLDFIKKGDIYAIDSKVSNGGTNQFLGTNGFLDSPETDFTLVDLGNNKYAIRTADNKYLATSEADEYVNFDRGVTDAANDTHAQWELLTRDQLIAELKNSGASANNPKDATFLMEASNLNRHDLRNNSTWMGIDFGSGEYGGVESTNWDSRDNFANSAIEKFNKTFDTYQTISGLPAGVYELTVQGYYRSGNTATAADKANAGTDVLRPFLYAKQNDKIIGQAPLYSIFDADVKTSGVDGFSISANGEYLPNSLADAGRVFRDGYYTTDGEYNKVRFVVLWDYATVQIGVKKNVLYDSDWTAFDNFRLTYLGPTGEAQTIYEHEIGTTLGTFYLKNAETGTYLTAGGTDGVSAVLGDKMYEHSIYENETKYNQYTAGSLNGQLKGVRETDFTFVVVNAEGYSIQTGIGDGYLLRNRGPKVNGKLDSEKGVFILESQGNNTYRIKHSSGSYLRYTTATGTKDTEVLHDWDFTRTLTTNANFAADAANWRDANGDGSRWYYVPATTDSPLLIGGNELDDTQGLLFKGGAEKVRIYRDQYLRLDGMDIVVTIPGLKAGDQVTVVTNSPNAEKVADRFLTNLTNLTKVKGFESMNSNEKWDNIATVTADGDVSFTTTGGINIYSIVVTREVAADGLGFENTTNPYVNGYNWVFQTKEELVAELDPTVASEDNPIDATFLLRGTAFHKEDSRNSAWTGIQSIGGEGGPDGAVHPNYVGEVSNVNSYDVRQKLTGIPNGVYELTLQGFTRSGGGHNAKYEAHSYMSIDEKTFVHHNIYVTSNIPAEYSKPETKYDASTLFEQELGCTAVGNENNVRISRIKVTDGTLTVGVYMVNPSSDINSLFMDNVRLTYLGNANVSLNPVKVTQGIIHKPSRFYELAEANGDLTLNTTTYETTKNNTTLSDKAMVKHDVLTGRWIQHTPVYEETIYAMPGQKLTIVMPSSYTNNNQSSNRYYQRIYNYATDDLFVEDAATTGVFDFSNGDYHTDARIREVMRVYEGTTAQPAGGWVMGTRWGQQLVSLFKYTAPTTFNNPIQIGLDHGDFTDVGDMSMFADLTEPTLSQRIVYTIQPASVMVNKLASCVNGSDDSKIDDDVFLEEKSISFPTIWYGSRTDMNGNDRNAVALDLQLKNYFTDAGKEPVSGDFTITLDDGGTGISLHTTKFSSNTDRFIQFNYPDGGEVTNYKDKEAIITVTSGGKNIARFRLHFVPNTELRPWGDIMGQGHLRRSPTYLEEHAVEIDRLDFDDRYAYLYPATWPVGTENTTINGVEEWRNVSSHDQFNPYPLDFDQTAFAANYFNAIWGQYSVMQSLRIPSYKDIRPFRDVNQLYHDHFALEGTTSQQQKYPGAGYFMYIDASNFPSSVATLKLEEDLCEGTTIHFSGWVSSMDHSKNGDGNNNGNAPGYLLFSIVGIKENGTQEVVESFCPGPIRADAIDYNGNKQLGAEYNAEVWGSGATSIWQQFAFSFVIKQEVANAYKTYALRIDNYCSHTTGGDMMVDDVRLYIQKAVPDIVQNSPICATGDVANGGSRATMEIYTTFEQLLNAVNMTEAASEEAAYEAYTDKQAGGKIIPSGWYCFLDKDVYDEKSGFSHAGKSPEQINALYDEAFNAALVTTGGNGGYYQFDFSTHFASNDGGKTAYTHKYSETGTDYVTYMARGESITNEGGTERRIYLNLEDCAVSLRSLPYYEKNGENWNNVTPVWSMNGSNATNVVYGHNDGVALRYVDLTAYDELRIYQSLDDAKTNGPVRCFFFPKAGTGDANFCVSYSNAEDTEIPDVACGMSFERVGDYWSVNLAKVKEETGNDEVKLICIKGSSSDKPATVTAINAVRKGAVLTPEKDYYIVFRAYEGETGTTTVGGPTNFFHLNQMKCAAMASFSLVSGTELRYDGGLDSEGVKYCEGQVATVKMEIKAIDTAAGVSVKEEDLFYDWWLGDITSFSTKADGKPDSPQGVLFDFRDAYPDATIYDGQQKRTETLDGYTYKFTEEDRAYLEELVKEGKFLLYQSSLNVKITNSSGYQAVSVMPIVALLENLTGKPYCKGPIEIRIPVEGKSPSAKNGFAGTSYPMDEVPVRIGLSQLKSATDADNASWVTDNTSSLYIPLRDVAFSDSKYNSFGKKKHKWGTGSSNTLDIAAVYLAETDDPDMVSYGEDLDKEGNRELRYVGKMHKFNATGASGRGRFEDYVELTFNPEFTEKVKEGYRYTLKTSFEESGTTTSSDGEGGTTTTTETNTGCAGDLLIPLYIVPEYQVWAGGPTGNWANDDNWRRADNPELKLAAGDPRPTNEQNTTASGFVPMSFTHVLMKTDTQATLEGVTKTTDGTELVVFPTTTQLGEPTLNIQYHLAAETKAPAPAFSWFPQERTRDIYCEPFYTNTAKEVHFEPRSQMLGSEHLTYQRAWVEYALTSGRWYALASPLQGVVSGDMYLPRNTGKQQTPYFQEITYDNTRYSRLAPAVYQQAWDKAEALTYRLERDELVNKLPPRLENGTAKVNVARALDWSREYNDAKVPFSQGGFSVKVDMSRTEGYVAPAEGVSDVLLRLPKSDKQYDYYLYDDDTDGSKTADLTELTGADGKLLRENAGKLMTDQLKNGGTMTVTLKNNGGDSNPYYLVANPFVSGLDLDEFFKANDESLLENSYWILNNNTYKTGVKTTEGWISTDNGETADRVAPLQAFFVKVKEGAPQELTLNFTREMAVALTDTTALKTRAAGDVPVLRLTARRHGVESHAMVVRSEDAAEGFVAGEDVEALFDSHLAQAPTLYTSAGDVAAAINVCRTLHGLPVGIASEDDSDVELLFEGVEAWTDELYLYDMESGESTPVTGSGSVIGVQGNSYGRYYLVTTPIDASATDPAPLVQVDGEVVTVTSLADEISAITVHDVPGRRVYRKENAGHRAAFTLPEGVYMVTVKTAHQQIVRKVQICDL